jgi:ubiquinone/menaquinone biosynthesis C-methylase UbiE
LGASKVVGIDISKALIEKAKASMPGDKFYVMNMEKLKFSDNSFDLVYSSLVLHYVKNWSKVLGEVKRVLKMKGLFIFSTHHPLYWGAEKKKGKGWQSHFFGFTKKGNRIRVFGDYFTTRLISEEWFGNFHVDYYHKPLSVMIKEILGSGFEIIDCSEPQPLPAVRKKDPNFWEKTKHLPMFIIFKLRRT